MKKNAVDKTLKNVVGPKKSGSFYLGVCNDSVISGYCIDAPPSAIYICRFILPSYDNIEFLHLSLGKRLLTVPQTGSEESFDLSDFLRRDWSEFSRINDSESLLRYIDAEQLDGTYSLWARYLTLVRRNDFSAAEELLGAGAAKSFSELRAISQNFAELSDAKNRSGWDGCSALLSRWLQKTKATYCP